MGLLPALPMEHQDPSVLRLLRPPRDPRELTSAPENSVVGAKPLDVGVLTIGASKAIGDQSIEGEMQRLPCPIARDMTATVAKAGTAANILGLNTQ